MKRSGGSSLLILVFFLIIAGLAFFEGGFPSSEDSPPSQQIPVNTPVRQAPREQEPVDEFPQDTSSSTGEANCQWIDYDDNYFDLSNASSVEECAQDLYNLLIENGDGEIFGSYQGTELYINNDGDVYSGTDRGDGTDWEYIGTLGEDTTIDEDQPLPTQVATRAPTTSGEPLTLDEIFTLVERDLDEYWSQQFEPGSRNIKPDIVLYDRSRVNTNCGTVDERMGPLYCPADHTAYFPRGFMEDQMRTVGDFAVVVIIAHEWGHSVQTMANLTPGDATIYFELQADCFAGAYSRYANTDSKNVLLEEGDLDEGAQALFLFGDPEGTEWFDEQAHGSGRQRYQAYQEGLDKGYETCLEFE